MSDLRITINEENELHCPICDYPDGTHARAAWGRRGSDIYENELPAGLQANESTTYRRSAVVLTFDCEHGHSFNVVFQQHKGTTYVWGERR